MSHAPPALSDLYLDLLKRTLVRWDEDEMVPLKSSGPPMYESTMDALNPLYPKVSLSGFVIIDDYGIPEDTCRRAIHDFRDKHGITAPIIDVDGTGAYGADIS